MQTHNREHGPDFILSPCLCIPLLPCLTLLFPQASSPRLISSHPHSSETTSFHFYQTSMLAKPSHLVVCMSRSANALLPFKPRNAPNPLQILHFNIISCIYIQPSPISTFSTILHFNTIPYIYIQPSPPLYQPILKPKENSAKAGNTP